MPLCVHTIQRFRVSYAVEAGYHHSCCHIINNVNHRFRDREIKGDPYTDKGASTISVSK